MSSGTKRPLPDEDGISRNGKAIKVKAEASPTGEDYSNDVKKKLESSSRTGQACDRCRVRKMRCDGGIEGCAPCLQNSSPCRTTDRMTGVANERGYVRKLELRIQKMQGRLDRLTGQLQSLGEEIKLLPVDGFDSNGLQPLPGTTQATTDKQQPVSSGRRIDDRPTVKEGYSLLESKECFSGDTYHGLSSGNSFISSIRGTSLNVLGMEIDLADNLSPDVEEPDPVNHSGQLKSNKSYRAFIQTALGIGPKPRNPGLPPRQEAFMYAEWCFKTVLPYLPVLHKPTFFATLSKFYDDPTFIPTSAEIVLVHIVLALMYFQVASRNYEDEQQRCELHRRSDGHYHYALGFYPDLVAGRTLEDVQALAMICAQLRSFTKPGACWMVTSTTLNIAIELGLHRSAQCWPSTAPRKNLLEVQMQKRVFWTIFLIHIYVSGKLGRPMALGECDFDVELPEALDDQAINEEGIDTSKNQRCGFLVGLEAFKSNLIFLDIYNNIYTVKRSPGTYLETIRRIERRIELWRQQWPEELIVGSPANQEQYRAEARYVRLWELELRLLLRHPSLGLTSSSIFNEESLSICLDSSKRMLEHVQWLQRHRCLDTNWQTNITYVLALSTTLYGHWVRKDKISVEDLNVLSDDMNVWLGVMGEVGSLIGSGKRLQESIQVVISRTIANLIQDLASRSSVKGSVAESPPGSGVLAESAPPPTVHRYGTPLAYPVPPQTADYVGTNHYPYPATPLSNAAAAQAPMARGTFPLETAAPPRLQAPVATGNTYPYADGNGAATSTTPYQAPLLEGPMAQPPASWRDFTGNVITNLEPHDFMTPASALLQLGSRPTAAIAPPLEPTSAYAHDSAVPPSSLDGTSAQQWPILLFGGPPAV